MAEPILPQTSRYLSFRQRCALPPPSSKRGFQISNLKIHGLAFGQTALAKSKVAKSESLIRPEPSALCADNFAPGAKLPRFCQGTSREARRFCGTYGLTSSFSYQLFDVTKHYGLRLSAYVHAQLYSLKKRVGAPYLLPRTCSRSGPNPSTASMVSMARISASTSIASVWNSLSCCCSSDFSETSETSETASTAKEPSCF